MDLDELDVDKLKTVPVDLSKLNNVVDNDVVKKNCVCKLVPQVNAICTNRIVLKTHYNTDKSGLEKKIDDASKKILDASGLVIKTDYNAKITDIEGEIPSITSLATTAALNAVNDKMSNVCNLLKKKQIMMQKISYIESKYFTVSGYNKFMNNIINNKTKEMQLVKEFWDS